MTLKLERHSARQSEPGWDPANVGLSLKRQRRRDLMTKLIMHAPDLITALIRVLKRTGGGQINYLFILKVLRNGFETPQQ